MATEQIQIIVSERGSRTVRRSLRDIGDDAERAEGAVSLLRRTLGALGVGLGVREIARLSDAATELRNRLAIAEGTVGDLTGAFDRLVDIANNARAPVEDLGVLFSRASVASRELGASQEDLFNFVDTVAKGLGTQGGSAAAASGALLQLSQALGAGTVRAEEFNSILEGAFPIAQAAANGIDRAGGSVARLRQLVIDGEISSSEFFQAILSQQEELTALFERSSPTIAQAFTVLRNNLIQLVNDFEEATGAGAALSSFIIVLANNLDLLAKAAVLAGAALAAAFVKGQIAAIATYITQVIALERALGAVSTRQALLGAGTKQLQGLWAGFNAILGASPIGRIVTVIVAATAALALFSNEVSLARESGATLGDAFVAAFQLIVEFLQPVIQFFKDAWASAIDGVQDGFEGFAGFIGDAFAMVAGFAKDYANAVIGLWSAAAKSAVDVWNNFPAALEALAVAAVNGLITAVQNGLNVVAGGVRDFLALIDSVAGSNLAGAIGEVDLSGLKLEASAEARSLGETVANNFREGLSTDFIGNGIDAILTRADDIAIARRNAEAGTTPTAPTAPTGGTSGTGGGRGGGGGGSDARSFEEIIAGINRETEALRGSNVEREIANELTSIEKELKRGLTEQEAALATQAIRNQMVMEERNAILEATQPPLAELEIRLEALNQLYQEGAISLAQYNAQLAQLRVEATETDNTFRGGLANGIARVSAQTAEFGQNVSDWVVGAFNSATDAIVEFAKTGQFNVRQFFQDLFAQLLKIAANQLFAQLLGGLFGGGAGGGLLGGIFGGFRAEGGPVTGGTPYVVGEKGPELFVPGKSGQVVSNADMQKVAGAQQAPAPQVNTNVNVAAVLSPSDVVGAFDNDDGETLVIRMLQRNASTVRNIVQG